MLRHASAITIYRDFTMIMICDLRNLQVVNIIANSQHDLICDQLFFHQIHCQLFCHFPDYDLGLHKIRGAMQYLAGADTVSLRSIGFDQVHGHRLIPPGMIDQKLRIDAEHPVQQIFVIVISQSSDRASGHIAHGKHSGGFQLLAVSGADSPEIRQRPVIPQKFPIADLIQFGNPDSVIIRFHMLRYNIHGNLAQVQIGSNSCCGGQPFFLQNLCCNSGC